MHRAHRRHHFLSEYGLAYLRVLSLCEFVAEILFHKINIAIDCLYPCLAALLALHPPRIRAQINELAQGIPLEILLGFLREFLHVLRHRPLLFSYLRVLGTVEDVVLGGRHVIGEHELTFHLVLAAFDGGEEVLIGLGDAHHLARDLVCHDSSLVRGSFIGCDHRLPDGARYFVEFKRHDAAVAFLDVR